MEKESFSQMLDRVARAYDATPEQIQEKITLALEEGQQSGDPQVRSLLASIPRAGAVLTPEEFVEYLARTLQSPYEP